DAAGRDVPALLRPVVGEAVEVPEGARVVEWAVLDEALPVVPPLDHVEGDKGPVAAAEGVSHAVEVEAPGVPAPFGEELEAPRAGMVAPDALLKLVPLDARRDGAPLRAVEPAVGPPGQRIHDRVGVL